MSTCSWFAPLDSRAWASEQAVDQPEDAGDFRITTAQVRAKDRFSFWTDFTSVHSEPIIVPNTPLHDYRSVALSRQRADVTITQAISDPMGFLRTPKRAGRLRSDRVRISYCRRVDGGIESGGKSARISDGAVYFRDYAGPGSFWTHDIFEETWLFVPRAWLVDSGKIAQDFDGAVFQADHFLAELMAQRIGAVVAHADDADGFTQAVNDLRRGIEDAFAARVSDSHRDKLLLKARQMHQIKAYLARHAGEIDLTPDRIADALGLARSTLYRLLKEEGLQVSAHVAEIRLAAIARTLRDPAWSDHVIGEIAAQWGHIDQAYFARAFKRRFGLTPGQWRAQGAQSNLRAYL